MLEWKMRGYVTPGDFTGTDAEKLQQALTYAAQSDIWKVVVDHSCHADAPITVPANMYLVLEDTLYADLYSEQIPNYSFRQDRIYVKGKGGKLVGNISFYHTGHVILEDLQIRGSATLEFCTDFRLENVEITEKLTLGRGCANAIAQNLQLGSVEITAENAGRDVPGREPNVRNIALRDSRITGDIQLTAEEKFGLLNIQIDHCSAQTVAVGKKDIQLPAAQYTNLTLLALEAELHLHNPCKNAHIAP